VTFTDPDLRQIRVELWVYRYRPTSIDFRKCMDKLQTAMSRYACAVHSAAEGEPSP